MIRQRFSSVIVLVLIVTQVLCPAVLWAAEQRSVQIEANDRVIISAINEGALTGETSSESRTLRFGETVNVGEELKTGNRTVAEVLIGNRAVITLGQSTTAQLTTVSQEQTTIQVTKGIVRVAASGGALGDLGAMVIQSPTNQVMTRGGVVQVIVQPVSGSIAQTADGEAKPYLTAYSPHTLIAALDTGGDIIQVEEGTAEIPGAGPGGETLTVTSGQSVTLQSGEAGSISELTSENTMRTTILANSDHSNTPKEGVENLVALQVDQATQLGQALTGAEKTGPDKAGKEDDSENAINGATGGVQLVSVVNTLFGNGGASNPGTSNPTNSTGNGFGGNNNNGFGAASAEVVVRVNGPARTTADGQIKPKSLLVFTTKEPVEPFLDGMRCDKDCLEMEIFDSANNNLDRVQYPRMMENGAPLTITSEFTVTKELVLIGGTPNSGHEGKAPTETLIVRGAAPEESVTFFTNKAATQMNTGFLPENFDGLFPTDRFPVNIEDFDPTPPDIANANSTFVVETPPRLEPSDLDIGDALFGGTFAQFSDISTADSNIFPDPKEDLVFDTVSFIDGAITATGSNIVLTGGVTLDRETVATIGTTTATNNYDTSLGGTDTKFTGSLLSVIHGPDGPTALTVQDRLLGVYDGSMIETEGGNKALLSVLDAKLKGPSNGAPLIDINAAFKDAGDTKHVVGPDGALPDGAPKVTVTSAVVTRSTMPLDGALLEASAPLLALTQATMTTTSHFADLAGNQAQSIQLNNTNNALTALNASQLMIESGHLLNLNNATAIVNGFLFSLNNSSTLQLDNGALFSVNNGSSLNLNATALGVFGSGTNTLSITNNLCASTCGTLVNSANTPFLLPNGSPLKMAGVSQDVVLPNSFNVFAGNPNSTVAITANDALFHVDETSTLTINGTAVVKPTVQ